MTPTEGRIEYLDVMRAILMMLGVVLHASQIYNPGIDWLVHSDDGSTFFFYLSNVIAAFRMPAFFFLSGFLSMMLVLRRGPQTFFRQRFRRIVLPLLVTALSLNVLQAWLLDATGWKDSNIVDYFVRGEWVQHLWFLVNLLVYVGILTLICMCGRIAAWCRVLRAALGKMPFPLLLALLPLLPVAFVSLNKIGIPVYQELVGTITLFTLFQYFSFFVIGCVVYSNEVIFDKFTSQSFAVLLFWAGLALILELYLAILPNSLLKSAAGTYLSFSINWLCICIFFSLFRTLVKRITPRWKYLSEASYTVYLFHHIVVVCLGLVFVALAVPAPIGFALIVPITLGLTFCVHSFLIARYPLLSLLFNGKLAVKEHAQGAGATVGVRSSQGSGLYGTDDSDKVSAPA